MSDDVDIVELLEEVIPQLQTPLAGVLYRRCLAEIKGLRAEVAQLRSSGGGDHA